MLQFPSASVFMDLKIKLEISACFVYMIDFFLLIFRTGFWESGDLEYGSCSERGR